MKAKTSAERSLAYYYRNKEAYHLYHMQRDGARRTWADMQTFDGFCQQQVRRIKGAVDPNRDLNRAIITRECQITSRGNTAHARGPRRPEAI